MDVLPYTSTDLLRKPLSAHLAPHAHVPLVFFCTARTHTALHTILPSPDPPFLPLLIPQHYTVSHYPTPHTGMDLRPEDFEWVTTEIMRIADLCCSGRVVSVLEGGYGRPSDTRHSSNLNENISKESDDVIEKSTTASSSGDHDGLSSAILSNTCTTDTETKSSTDSHMASVSAGKDSDCPLFNRDVLAASAAAHVRRLVDPYGPRSQSVQHSAVPIPPSSACTSSPPPSYPQPASASLVPGFPSSSSALDSPASASLLPSSTSSSSSSCTVHTDLPHTQSPSHGDTLSDLPLDLPTVTAKEEPDNRDELIPPHTAEICTDELT